MILAQRKSKILMLYRYYRLPFMSWLKRLLEMYTNALSFLYKQVVGALDSFIPALRNFQIPLYMV